MLMTLPLLLVPKLLSKAYPTWLTRRWRYWLNSSKSVIMIFGEAARTRVREKGQRVWHFGEAVASEVDEQHHLGILRSVGHSTIARAKTKGKLAA